MCWNFSGSTANESTLKPLCEQVDRHFRLPSDRYYRYFAVQEDEAADHQFIAQQLGQYCRGLHVVVSGKHDVCQYFVNRCIPPEDLDNYDNLIYIRHSTCLNPTGCVITYAHELQHTVQESLFPKLMGVNFVLYHNLKRFLPSATEIDIPTERDANIVSKSVAEMVCGAGAVKRFAEEQVQYMKRVCETDQLIRWEFFLNLQSYNWVSETRRLVQEFKGRMSFGIDVEKPDWWKGRAPDTDPGEY